MSILIVYVSIGLVILAIMEIVHPCYKVLSDVIEDSWLSESDKAFITRNFTKIVLFEYAFVIALWPIVVALWVDIMLLKIKLGRK